MQIHNLYQTKQSAYREGHSTETALLRIHNDLLTATDSHRASCLVLLDFSAAFDTVDYIILLSRLSDNVGLSGVPRSWFASYLGGRTQTVKAVCPCERGVMRGAMRSMMGMRDECLHMRVINFSALRCSRDFIDCTQAVVCQVT